MVFLFESEERAKAQLRTNQRMCDRVLVVGVCSSTESRNLKKYFEVRNTIPILSQEMQVFKLFR